MKKVINWKVRFKNWGWVSGFIAQLLIVAEMIITGLNSMGVTDFQLTDMIKDYVLGIANAVFILLSMHGIVQDLPAKGYSDSEQALKYDEPK
jgi:phi LC3 family holin